jgi:hypothetical protein
VVSVARQTHVTDCEGIPHELALPVAEHGHLRRAVRERELAGPCAEAARVPRYPRSLFAYASGDATNFCRHWNEQK